MGIGGDPGSAFEIHQTGKGLVVYGWAGSVVTAIRHGFVIHRKPVEEIPLKDEDFHCRVCGYRSDDPPWGIDGVSPIYDFCDCCGVEHGYQDCLPAAARQYRDRWIASGAEWYTKKLAPADWDLRVQLEGVPVDFKCMRRTRRGLSR